VARIRTIKPDFFRHSDLYQAEREFGLPLRLAFAGLWTAADREGRFKWKPLELKLDCLPHDEVDFSRVLDALATRGFIVKYALHGSFFGFIPSWHDHQAINNREAASVLPDPKDCATESTTSTRDARVIDASATRLVQESGEGKGREGEKEKKESGDEKPSPVANPPELTLVDDGLPDTKPRKPRAKNPAFDAAIGILGEPSLVAKKIRDCGADTVQWAVAETLKQGPADPKSYLLSLLTPDPTRVGNTDRQGFKLDAYGRRTGERGVVV
jgi:hypothetical protein